MDIVVKAVTVVATWNVAMLPLPLTVTPEGRVHSMQLAGIGTPLLVSIDNVKLLPGFTDVAERPATLILVIVLLTTSIGIATDGAPLAVTVTVAVPPAPEIGVTVAVDPLVVAKQPLTLSEMTAQFVSELVHVGETVEPPPLTSVPVAENCRVPAPLVELRTAVSGVIVRLASEFGETKKPLQPIINPATATRLIRARTAVPVLDIAPP